MPIAFTDKDWDRVADTWTRWWAGSLDRPVVCARLLDAIDPNRPAPKAPMLKQSNCLDFSIGADDMIDRADYELSKMEFLGDSFPYFDLTAFGPGVAAALIGGTMDNSSGGVWFGKPPGNPPIEEIRVKVDYEHPVLLRTTELIRAAQKRWGERVLICYPDLGGVMDIMASLCGSEELLMLLYDEPQSVHRLRDDVTACWWELLNYFHNLVKGVNRGYSGWLNVFTPKLTYVTQSDFSYMISPAAYAEFAHPELCDTWERLPKAAYHLDGKGELPHLPKMLSAPGLDAIQWVPGDGSPDETQWPEVYQTITSAGRKVICNSLFALPSIVEQTGRPRQIAATNNNGIRPEKWESAKAIIRAYGA